jgi:DNA-binding transcriptional MerR regulator
MNLNELLKTTTSSSVVQPENGIPKRREVPVHQSMNGKQVHGSEEVLQEQRDSNELSSNVPDAVIDNTTIENHETSGQGSSLTTENDESEELLDDNHSELSSVLSSSHSWNHPQQSSAEGSGDRYHGHGYNIGKYVHDSGQEKLLSVLKKLKKENFSLKESLEQAQVNDLTLLKTKLRGTNADLMRYKLVNAELKEKIQSLEDRITNLLDEDKVPERGEKLTVVDLISQKLKQKKALDQFQQQNQPQPSDDGEGGAFKNRDIIPSPSQNKNGSSDPAFSSPGLPPSLSINEGEKQSHYSLLTKCRHYEKLLKVYEKNMAVMQVNLLYFYLPLLLFVLGLERDRSSKR